LDATLHGSPDTEKIERLVKTLGSLDPKKGWIDEATIGEPFLLRVFGKNEPWIR
jgi:hypothetical protein